MGCKQSKTRFSEPAVGHSPPSELRPADHVAADDSSPGRRQERDARTQDRQTRHVDPAAATGHDVNNVTDATRSPQRRSSETVSKYKGIGPQQHGDVQPCFKDGLLYRIVQTTAWYFYNDTQEYEMHVSFTFGAGSELTAVPPASMQPSAGEAGAVLVSVIVYPGETVPFVEGKFNGYKSNIAAQPLSSEYRNKMNAASNRKVQQELDVIQKLSRGSKDIQRILEACVRQGVPFVDVTFPPLQASLYRPGVDSRAIAEMAWKRPTDYLPPNKHHEISLFCNGVDPNDIDQGQLGDCWLLCSIAALAEFPTKVEDMFAHPISNDAALQEQRVGAYRVTLNKHGWWHIILVDDYLPVVGSKPSFAKCVDDPAELWVSLLEKAYAKLHGSYAAITGGDALQALQDLTGYPVYRLDEEFMACATDASKALALFHKILAYDEQHFLVNLNTPGHDTSAYMGCGAAGKNSAAMEERYKKAGLALGHAYTALQCRFFPQHDLRLVQIRNPWGNGVEWTGRWGDKDPSWQQYPDVAQSINFVEADDGTFWMAWEDVLRYFDGGGVCFTRFDWHDYRARGRFENGFPTLVFEVTVSQPVEAYCIVSQKDKRGLAPNDPDAKYSAMMLSVSRSQNSTSSSQKVHLNSSANTEEPSEEFTFNYARDLGLKYRFVPEDSPYYVIPRIYDAGGNRDYILGLISDHPATGTIMDVSFVSLPKTCRVFHNYPSFAVEETTALLTDYQQNLEVGAPETKRGYRIE
jgi:hypothetical protein